MDPNVCWGLNRANKKSKRLGTLGAISDSCYYYKKLKQTFAHGYVHSYFIIKLLLDI